MTLRDEISSRDFSVQSGKNCPIRAGKLNQVTISGMLGSLNPCGKLRDVMTVGNKCNGQGACLLKAEQ
jgi:hypothetical protein